MNLSLCAAKQWFHPVTSSWKASQGIGCALVIILLSFGMNQALRIAYDRSAAFADWVGAHSLFAESSFHLLQGCMWVVVAYLFAGVQPVSVFVRETGFARRLAFSGWLFAWGAIAFGLLNIYFVQRGWVREDLSAKKFYHGGQLVWLGFVAQSTLLAPFVEEVVMRGFLYRAFRGSFALLPSTLLVLGFATYFHWGLVSQDFTALVFMIAFGTALCVIRECVENTWSCVLFHAVYNLTVHRQWLISLVAIAILLLLCDCGARAKESSASPAQDVRPIDQ